MESGLDDAELIETGQPTGSIVSLADIKASGVTFEWFEALATTLQLCHGIAESPEPTGPRPSARTRCSSLRRAT